METVKGTKGMNFVHFATQVVRGRWFMMFASFLIMSGAGTAYVFGIYSPEIKKSLGYDQKTLNLLGFFIDLGTVMGVLSGVVAELTPIWFVLLIGAVLNFFGYFMIWLSVTGKIAKPKVWQMCLYIFTGTNSQAFPNTGVLVACLKNFPQSRGIMLGVLKGFSGLSGAVVIQIYHAIYGDNSKSLILLIGWLPATVSIIFLSTVRIIKGVQLPNEVRVFYRCLYISIGLALFLMVITILQKIVTFSHPWYSVCALAVCTFLFLPLAIAVREEFVLWKLKEQPPIDSYTTIIPGQQPPKQLEPTSEVPNQIVDNPKPFSFSVSLKAPERGEDYSILQGILNMDMFLIFVSTFCGYGTNLTAIDNLGQIGESLGYPTLAISTCVSLVSIWNYCGRVFAGVMTEILLMKWRFPRPFMITVVLVFSCVGHLLIAFPTPGSLYIASLIIGFSYGAQLIMIYTITSELFGLKHFATFFNWAQVSSPLGSYVLNVRLAGVLYDKEALKQLASKGLKRGDVRELTCIGKECYRLAFVVLAGVSLLGAVSSLILVFRTRNFYRGDIYKKFREEAKDAELAMA